MGAASVPVYHGRAGSVSVGAVVSVGSVGIVVGAVVGVEVVGGVTGL
jgi:hypothetical protein